MSKKNLACEVESIALALSEEGGYEYYHIDDELRELAKDISYMQEENAKLREQVDAAHMSRLLTENENEKLRELVSGVHMAYVGTLNECESLNEELIWECSGNIDADVAKSRAKFKADRHRFDAVLRELGVDE